MKKFIASALLALVLPMAAMANEGVALEHANIDIHDQPSLQRGARDFTNYCMGCHSLNFSRYNRLAVDLGLSEKEVKDNLIFTRTDGEPTKVGDVMRNGMQAKDVSEAFGAAPPDLSLAGRSRGGDWIYTYLKSFYADPSRPMGVNNTVLANAGMPHVLWELQGMQEKVCTKEGKEAEHEECHLVLSKPGKLTPSEYDDMAHDLANFLVYVGEPAKLHRSLYGIFTILFLMMFAVLAYLLKKEYWKDVH